MMNPIPDNIKITVESSSEAVSILFAMRIIRVLKRLMRKDMKVASIFPDSVFQKHHQNIRMGYEISLDKDKECDFIYENSNAWCFDTAVERLEHIRNKYDINTIVLDSSYMEWKTQNEAINYGLDAFEGYLENHGITVINCWGSVKEQQELEDLFCEVSSWVYMPFHQICRAMLDDFCGNNYSFAMPRGLLPYFMIHPKTSIKEILSGYEFNMLVGFQPWSYSDIIDKHGKIEFPMWHWLPMGFDGIHVGPVPIHTDQII